MYGSTAAAADSRWLRLAALLFGLSIGVGTVVIPLLALSGSFTPADVGWFAVAGAGAHLVVRGALPTLLGTVPDRRLIMTASGLMAASYGALVFSADVLAFVLAQIAAGAGRGLFWTASQTHVVRVTGEPVRSVGAVNTYGSLGQMIGPACAGLLVATAPTSALAIGALAGAAAVFAGSKLLSLPAYGSVPRGGRGSFRRPISLVGYSVAFASFANGSWRSLLISYVPVILVTSGTAPGHIGFILASADLAAITASAFVARRGMVASHASLNLAVVVAAAGIVAIPVVAHLPVAAAAALAVGGGATGFASVLAPAIAAEQHVGARQALSLSRAGTFRAFGMLIAPAGVAVTAAVLPVSVGLAVVAAVSAVPSAFAFARRVQRPLRS